MTDKEKQNYENSAKAVGISLVILILITVVLYITQ